MAKDKIRSIFHLLSFYFSFKRFPVNALRRIASTALFFSLNKKKGKTKIVRINNLFMCFIESKIFRASIFLICGDVTKDLFIYFIVIKKLGIHLFIAIIGLNFV